MELRAIHWNNKYIQIQICIFRRFEETGLVFNYRATFLEIDGLTQEIENGLEEEQHYLFLRKMACCPQHQIHTPSWFPVVHPITWNILTMLMRFPLHDCMTILFLAFPLYFQIWLLDAYILIVSPLLSLMVWTYFMNIPIVESLVIGS